MSTKKILTVAVLALAFSALSTGTASAQNFGFSFGYDSCSPSYGGYYAPTYYGGYSSCSPQYGYSGGYRSYPRYRGVRARSYYPRYRRFRGYRGCY